MTAATAVTRVLFFCSWWWATGYKQLSGAGSAGSLLSVPPPPLDFFASFLQYSSFRLASPSPEEDPSPAEETKRSKWEFTPLSSEDRTWKQQRFWYFLSRAVNHRLPCWWENWAESLLGSYSPMSIGEIRVSEQYFYNHYFLLLVKLWVRAINAWWWWWFLNHFTNLHNFTVDMFGIFLLGTTSSFIWYQKICFLL